MDSASPSPVGRVHQTDHVRQMAGAKIMAAICSKGEATLQRSIRCLFALICHIIGSTPYKSAALSSPAILSRRDYETSGTLISGRAVSRIPWARAWDIMSQAWFYLSIVKRMSCCTTSSYLAHAILCQPVRFFAVAYAASSASSDLL